MSPGWPGRTGREEVTTRLRGSTSAVRAPGAREAQGRAQTAELPVPARRRPVDPLAALAALGALLLLVAGVWLLVALL